MGRVVDFPRASCRARTVMVGRSGGLAAIRPPGRTPSTSVYRISEASSVGSTCCDSGWHFDGGDSRVHVLHSLSRTSLANEHCRNEQTRRYGVLVWFMLVTRAAVAEETLFRGYPIERLLEVTRSRFAAGAISWSAFTITHLSGWGWAQLLVAGTGGLILTALYLWRRNLAANITAHWIADGTGFLLPG